MPKRRMTPARRRQISRFEDEGYVARVREYLKGGDLNGTAAQKA